MPTDNKIGLSLVKKCQEGKQLVENGNAILQAVKDAYQIASPDVNAPGFPLTAQQVADVNTFITDLNALLSVTYAPIISIIDGINVGSHRGNALD